MRELLSHGLRHFASVAWARNGGVPIVVDAEQATVPQQSRYFCFLIFFCFFASGMGKRRAFGPMRDEHRKVNVKHTRGSCSRVYTEAYRTRGVMGESMNEFMRTLKHRGQQEESDAKRMKLATGNIEQMKMGESRGESPGVMNPGKSLMGGTEQGEMNPGKSLMGDAEQVKIGEMKLATGNTEQVKLGEMKLGEMKLGVKLGELATEEQMKGTSFGYVEAAKLEYAAKVLQKQVKLIIDDAPDFSQLNNMSHSPNLDMSTRLSLQQNHLIQLVSKLKSIYNMGKLPIFDHILDENIHLESMASQPNWDQSESALSSPPGSSATSLKASPQPPSPEKTSRDDSPSEPKNPSDDPWPPLPKIHDPYLHARVFVHKSTINNKSYLNQSELINAHNERLEFLGDSVLNNLVTLIVYDRFPHASEGDMSKIRSSLINNATLTEFSIMYGFDKKLKSNIHEQFLRQGRQKVFADIFEAYIGALTIEHGFQLDDIKSWLHNLMDAKLSGFDRKLKKVEQINKDAKSELYSLVGTAASHPQYQVIQTGDGATVPYIIRCMMGKDILGEGVAPGLKEAGLRAAMQALKNKPLLEKYIQIRLHTDRAQSIVKNADSSALSILTGVLNKHSAPDGIAAPKANSEQDAGSHATTDVFPIVSKDSDELRVDAKNEVYALLGHSLGITPKYVVSQDESGFKAELLVGDRVLAIGHDMSKKRATTKAATAILYQKDALLNYLVQ